MVIYDIEKLDDNVHIQKKTPNPQIYTLYEMGAELEGVVDGIIGETGTVGTDTKPIKLVEGVATPVANDLVDTTNEQTITGVKTFSPSNGNVVIEGKINSYVHPAVIIRMKNTPAEGNPGAAVWGGMQFVNAGNVEIGSFTYNRDNTGSSNIHLYVKNSDGNRASFKVCKDSNNAGYVLAPSRPYSADHGTDVVTINSIASNPEVVHTTGNESISGSKTFTGRPITINVLGSGAASEVSIKIQDNRTDADHTIGTNPAAITLGKIGFFDGSGNFGGSLHISVDTNGVASLNVNLRNSDGTIKTVSIASGDVIQ